MGNWHCPKCGAYAVFYVDRVYEIRKFNTNLNAFPLHPENIAENKEIDLEKLIDTMPDKYYSPYVYCFVCGSQFNLDGTEKKPDYNVAEISPTETSKK